MQHFAEQGYKVLHRKRKADNKGTDKNKTNGEQQE